MIDGITVSDWAQTWDVLVHGVEFLLIDAEVTVGNLLLILGRAQQFACNNTTQPQMQMRRRSESHTRMENEPQMRKEDQSQMRGKIDKKASPRLLRDPDVLEDPDKEDTVVSVVMLLRFDLKLNPLLPLW